MNAEPERIAIINDKGIALCLSSVKWEDGRPVSGYVENGDWYWKVVGDEETASDMHDRVVNRWPANTDYRIIDAAGLNYNEAIDRAFAQATSR